MDVNKVDVYRSVASGGVYAEFKHHNNTCALLPNGTGNNSKSVVSGHLGKSSDNVAARL